MRPVFLIGFMATGKTTVGRLVAERLGRVFVDLDAVIADAAGASVAEVFRHEGEEGFRRREQQALAAICKLADVVVATGGGAASREANLERMLASGVVVALSATPAEVMRRTQGDATRPLLAAAGGNQILVESLLRQREPFYEQAHVRVDTVAKTPDGVADEVVRAVAEREVAS